MDNLTHTLAAIALARAGGKRFTPHATAILVLAANIPDIDSVWGFVSPLAYLQHHRGITHSFFAAPFLAAAVVALVALSRSRLRKPAAKRASSAGSSPVSTGTSVGNGDRRDAFGTSASSAFPLIPAYFVALFGVVVDHLFLDWTTSYGTRLLLPFSGRWLSWDAVPIIDLWLLGVLLAAAVLPFFFGMIGEEIGARGGPRDRSHTRGRSAAIFALTFLAAWFGFRGVMHTRAVAALDARLYHGYAPERVGAFASLGNPFRWTGVVQTPEGWEVAQVNVLEEFDPDAARTYFWPEPSPALEAARRTHTARVFLDFARYPYSYFENTEDGYRVVFRDLRFQDSLTSAKAFVAEVFETRQFQVVEESFSFRGPRNTR